MEQMVLVGTSDGIQAVGTYLPRMPAGRSIDHVVAAADGVWALADRRTIWHDAERGGGREVARVDDVSANCLLADGERLLVGTSTAGLYELTGDRLERLASFDQAPGRAEWYTPWGEPPDVRSLACGVEGHLYVNVHVGGVVRSQDGGDTWAATMDIDADVHQVIADPHRPHRAYAAAAIGLGVTSDGGDTWRFTTAGLAASYCRAVAVSDRFVFVSASNGPGGRSAALYRRPLDSDAPLTRCAGGLPEWFSTNLDTFCLVADGPEVVAADAAGTVYRSTDEGDTWSMAATGLPQVRCVAII